MGNSGGDSDERPEHAVALSSFKMNAAEVTEASYDSCVTAGKCTKAHYEDGTCRVWNGSEFVKMIIPPSARNGSYPVVCVTWRQARQFCRSRGMDLPSEAQWEYAARAGNSGVRPPGGCGSCGRTGGPLPAGSGKANSWGLFDMTGNAWEWLLDYYDPEGYAAPDTVDPAGPAVGIYRVIRGGGWYSAPGNVSLTDRQWYSPEFPEASIGFRCAGH